MHRKVMLAAWILGKAHDGVFHIFSGAHYVGCSVALFAVSVLCLFHWQVGGLMRQWCLNFLHVCLFLSYACMLQLTAVAV